MSKFQNYSNLMSRVFFPIWSIIKISFWNKSLETLSSESHASLLGWQPVSRTTEIRDSQRVREIEEKWVLLSHYWQSLPCQRFQ